MSGITVTRRDDRLVAVKQATAAGCERRRREAHLLASLGHPGVVEFVDLIEGDPTELHMNYAGTDSWERHPPTSEETIISGLAAVASTIADLHDLGTAHQSLAPEHVLVTSDHRPVLCGFADAEQADPFTCAEDLAGLAGLIGYVSAAAPADLKAHLGDLATLASTGKLSARRLGEELLALHGLEREPTPRRAGVDRRLAAAAVAVLAGLLFVGWWLAGPDRAATPVAATTTSVASPTSVAGPTSVATPPPSPPETVTVAPPTVESLEVQYGGRRFGIGQEGDILLLGDWNCDGVATPALLETALGRVAIFAVWPDADTSVGPETTIAMPGATDLELVETDGCDQIRVIDPRGSTLFTPELP